ncbi:MAG: divergent polysaccharide deacetylase family protein [Pseudomonadota bacterium]
MLRGILLGSVSGLALSGLLLVSVSLLVPPPGATVSARVPDRPDVVAPPAPDETAVIRPDPLPRRAETPAVDLAEVDPAAEIDIPAGSQFGRPREDVAVVTPDGDQRPQLAASSGPSGGDAPPSAPVADTRSAAVPGTARFTSLAPPPTDGSAPDLPAPIDERAPQTFRSVDPGEDQSAAGDDEAPDIAAEDAAPETPDVTAEAATVADTETPTEDVAETPAGPTDPIEDVAEPAIAENPAAEIPVIAPSDLGNDEIAIEDDTPPVVAEQPPAGGAIARADADPVAVASPDVEPLQTAQLGQDTIRVLRPDEIVVPNRTPAPEILDESDPVESDPTPSAEDVAAAAEAALPRRLVLDSQREEAEEAPPAEIATAETPDQPARALDAFAAPVERRSGIPIFAVVLIDDSSAGLDRGALIELDIPIAFAIDASARDASDAMATYRAAGHEVLLIGDALAPDGAPQDIEIALAGARAAVPEALAILDRADEGFAGQRQALSALLPSLEEAGMGFVSYPGGLGSGVQTAIRQGVPAAQLYRVLDDQGQQAPMIVRFLDRATFEAAQDGSAIVVGRTTPETMEALQLWSEGDRVATVDLVPVSEVLRGTLP